MLLLELIVPIDLLWEKWRLTISAVSSEICEFFIRLLPKSLNLIGFQGNIKRKLLKNISNNPSQKP